MRLALSTESWCSYSVLYTFLVKNRLERDNKLNETSFRECIKVVKSMAIKANIMFKMGVLFVK